MTTETEAQSPIDRLARDTGFGPAAIASMRRSLERGGGRMAQFDHPEFGGPGQWMQGGLTMVSDGDRALKRRIDALCEGLAAALADEGASSDRADEASPDAVSRGDRGWYPAALGRPDSSGSQDGMRYAWFAGPRRLAVDDGHGVTLRDTGDHRIGGVSQQQGDGRSLTFTSQHGLVDIERLPIVDGAAPAHDAHEAHDAPRAAPTHGTPPVGGPIDPFEALERLALLHARGVVDSAEFHAKKAELLARI